MKTTLPLLILFAMGLSASQAQEVLRWHFRPGEELHYTREDERLTQRPAEPGWKESLLRVTDLTLAVVQVNPDGSADITQTIDRVRYQKTAPGATVHYDSDHSDSAGEISSRLAATFRELLDNEFLFRVSPRGDLNSVRVLPKAAQRNSGVAGRPVAQATAEELRHLLPFSTFPDDAVEPGKTWSEQSEFVEPVLGLCKRNTGYRFTGRETYAGRPAERITFNAELSFVPTRKSGVRFLVRDRESRGTLFFDNTAGRLLLREENEALKLAILARERSIDEEIRSSVRIKLIP